MMMMMMIWTTSLHEVVQHGTQLTKETCMAIGSAIERGSLIHVYDERGRTLFQKAIL